MAGGRYEILADGLHIKNVTLADNGEYTCRAEVEQDGRYDERKINVSVHSRPTSSFNVHRDAGRGGSNGVQRATPLSQKSGFQTNLLLSGVENLVIIRRAFKKLGYILPQLISWSKLVEE